MDTDPRKRRIEQTATLIEPEFAPVLRGFDLRSLSADPDVVYGVWPDLRIAYLNPAWFKFFADNSADRQVAFQWGLGRRLSDAFPAPIKDFYTAAYARVLERGVPWQHDYECSSAERFRQFRLIAYPVGASQGLLVVNSLVVERAHDAGRIPLPAIAALYESQFGIITQCSHCRRVRRAHEPKRWDWVPAWIAKPHRQVSHGLCPRCLDFYYRAKQPELFGDLTEEESSGPFRRSD